MLQIKFVQQGKTKASRRGVRKLTGENQKLVRAKFSTNRLFQRCACINLCGCAPTYIVENSAQILSCKLKFVHAAGQNLGRVFNLRQGCALAPCNSVIAAKQANLKLKTRSQ
jgi:hypothetical protein